MSLAQPLRETGEELEMAPFVEKQAVVVGADIAGPEQPSSHPMPQRDFGRTCFSMSTIRKALGVESHFSPSADRWSITTTMSSSQ
jgi:hypothetical protein